MNPKNGWRFFFDTYAPKYMDESFTTNTLYEIDFIVEELRLQPGAYVLDIGCGTGRHTVQLAKRGYRMTGIDLSEGMLAEAREACRREGVAAEFIQADAADFKVDRLYDACICLCEGAFGLLSMEEDPFERDLLILRHVSRALKKGGGFLLTALNGLRMIRSYNDEDVAAGRFDPLGLAEVYPLTKLLPEAPPDLMMKEKGFTAAELTHLLKAAGFAIEHIWGGTAGSWNRQPLSMDEMELMVVARKVGT